MEKQQVGQSWGDIMKKKVQTKDYVELNKNATEGRAEKAKCSRSVVKGTISIVYSKKEREKQATEVRERVKERIKM